MMRILLAIQNNTNSAVKDSNTWYRNLYEPLIELGHEVILFNTNDAILARRTNSKRLKEKVSENLLALFNRENNKKHIDLFFGYLTDGMIDFNLISEIRKKEVITTNFSCNNIHQFYLVKEIAKYFDYNLYSEKDAKKHFDSISVRSLWWPMASNPKYFYPKRLKKKYSVTFVGSNYSLRAKYIYYLLENNVNVEVFGPGWKYAANTKNRAFFKRYYLLTKSVLSNDINLQAKYSGLLFEHDFKRKLANSFPNNLNDIVSDEKLINLYSESEISLGFLEVYNQHDPSNNILKHMHLRDFEAPMCRAFYITGYSDELAEMFIPEKEVITYRDNYELLEKVRYYLKNQNQQEIIREAGYQRALREHTYQKRFQDLFHMIFK
jgi:spore maturation protein CgeB